MRSTSLWQAGLSRYPSVYPELSSGIIKRSILRVGDKECCLQTFKRSAIPGFSDAPSARAGHGFSPRTASINMSSDVPVLYDSLNAPHFPCATKSGG